MTPLFVQFVLGAAALFLSSALSAEARLAALRIKQYDRYSNSVRKAFEQIGYKFITPDTSPSGRFLNLVVQSLHDQDIADVICDEIENISLAYPMWRRGHEVHVTVEGGELFSFESDRSNDIRWLIGLMLHWRGKSEETREIFERFGFSDDHLRLLAVHVFVAGKLKIPRKERHSLSGSALRPSGMGA
jgi:hypothetical protein